MGHSACPPQNVAACLESPWKDAMLLTWPPPTHCGPAPLQETLQEAGRSLAMLCLSVWAPVSEFLCWDQCPPLGGWMVPCWSTMLCWLWDMPGVCPQGWAKSLPCCRQSWPHTRQNHGCRDPSCETPKRVSCCSSPRVSRGIYRAFTTQCYVNSGHFQIWKEHITCPWVNHCFSGLSHESICICHVLLHSKLLLSITVGYNKNPLCLMSAWVRHLGAAQLDHSHSCGPLALQLALRHWLSWGLPPACSLRHPVI